jgi:peptidyl-prolyl cis-trans isomerase C
MHDERAPAAAVPLLKGIPMFFSAPVSAPLAFLAGLALAGAALAAGPPAPAGDPVVARVNGVELHRSDVDAARQSLPPQAQQMPMEKLYPILLDRMVDNALVTEAGRAQHLDQDPQVREQLKRDEDQLVERAYLERAIDKASTQEALKAKYQEWVKGKPAEEEVHARHILVKSEDEAKSIIAQLQKGADFADLAKKYSTDPSGSSNGGDLGWFGKNEMVPEFAEAAFATPKGQYTKTPVKTQFGWHVIEVLDRRTKLPPSFQEAQPELRNLIARDVISAQLADLRKGAKIETFGLDGKPLPPQPKP